jgi:hypothetical protein
VTRTKEIFQTAASGEKLTVEASNVVAGGAFLLIGESRTLRSPYTHLTAEATRTLRDALTEILGDAPTVPELSEGGEIVVTSSHDEESTIAVERSGVGDGSFVAVNDNIDTASLWLTVDETREVIAALSATLEPLPAPAAPTAPTFAVGDLVKDADGDPAVVIDTRDAAEDAGREVHGDYRVVAIPGNSASAGLKYWQDAESLTPA